MADKLTVILPTFERSHLLDRMLSSIADCSKPSIYDKTIVVENGPQVYSKAIASRYKSKINAQYLYTEQAGKSHALNFALTTLDPTLVVFFDNDIRLHKDALMQYAKAATGKTEGEFYGGPLDVDYESTPPEWLTEFLPGSARGWGLNGLDQEANQWFIGSNWAAFSDDIKEAGGFDVNIGPKASEGGVGDETDMQQRLEKNGVRKVFVPGALVWHYVPKNRCSPVWVLRRVYRNGVHLGYDQSNISEPTFIGLPEWMYHALLVRSKSVLKELIGGTKITRYRALRDLVRLFGRATGYRRRINT